MSIFGSFVLRRVGNREASHTVENHQNNNHPIHTHQNNNHPIHTHQNNNHPIHTRVIIMCLGPLVSVV